MAHGLSQQLNTIVNATENISFIPINLFEIQTVKYLGGKYIRVQMLRS
jgi:hypothetical protein